jgi:predicted CopG family antitoxin
MAKVITISDDVYKELVSIKGERSFSQVIRDLLKNRTKEKRKTKEDLIKFLMRMKRDGKRENLSERIDEVLYK